MEKNNYGSTPGKFASLFSGKKFNRVNKSLKVRKRKNKFFLYKKFRIAIIHFQDFSPHLKINVF